MRLGRYKQQDPGDKTKTKRRALKVILDSHATQQKIMDNAKKKTSEMHQLISKQLASVISSLRKREKQLKRSWKKITKNKKSSTHEYKFREPPWNLEIKEFWIQT